MNKIDITKTYATRSGLPVRIYAVDGAGAYPVHGALFDGAWIQHAWTAEGSWTETPHSYNLVPVKTWRAWEKGEVPKFFMVRSKDGGLMLGLDRSKIDCFKNLFSAFYWLHEDGTTTPCGVLDG